MEAWGKLDQRLSHIEAREANREIRISTLEGILLPKPANPPPRSATMPGLLDQNGTAAAMLRATEAPQAPTKKPLCSRPNLSQETRDQILRWFAAGRGGVSSRCIAFTMLGIELPAFGRWTPSDPSDFCRCLKLLRIAPEIRQHMDAMRAVSKEWSTLVDCWDEIESCFMAEVPGWLDGMNECTPARRTFDLMYVRASRKP
jgi:hypothetical protein